MVSFLDKARFCKSFARRYSSSVNAGRRLVLFDIATRPRTPSTDEEHATDPAWNLPSYSPNTIRARLALHYKQIQYTQSWISYPDIGRLWSDLGIKPEANTNGPACTLPVLLLNANGFDEQSVSDLKQAGISGIADTVETRHGIYTPVVSTLSIARTLDALCGDATRHPLLFPVQRAVEDARFAQFIVSRVVPALRRLMVFSVPDVLDDRGADYFIRTRTREFNVSSLDILRPRTPEEAQKIWHDVEDAIEPLLVVLGKAPLVQASPLDTTTSTVAVRKQHLNPTRYLAGGTTPTYGDFIIMALLAWVARIDPRVWTNLTQNVGNGALNDLWMGCLPYLHSPGRLDTVDWFAQEDL